MGRIRSSRRKQFADERVDDALRKLGVDTKFLMWLEGEEDRLPRLGALKEFTGDQFAAAIRATSWLRGLSISPDMIAPISPAAWEGRYDLLKSFLNSALVQAGWYRMEPLNRDLEVLEAVLAAVFPLSSWERYQADIRDLRKKGQPFVYRLVPQPTGGKPQSEQTQRMRAAVGYLRTFRIKAPYRDLANFWNESLPQPRYDADAIKQRLRKRSRFTRSRSDFEHWRFWRNVYYLDYDALRQVFPVPFPPSREFRKLWTEKTGAKTPWD